ncbi:MAG: adenine deaminase [Bacteroidota bacterium]
MFKGSVGGNIVDVINGKIFKGKLFYEEGVITSVEECSNVGTNYILPGFVDAHVHVESSMVTPVEFSRMAVRHGTIAAVSDPHEIGNVLGVEGVRFMVENGNQTPFKFLFGAPSCVPATPFESSGAMIDDREIENLLKIEGVGFLAEMMNFPGVVHGDPMVMKKLKMAQSKKMKIDGHAPGLSGKDLEKYVKAGITTDHECGSRNEALEKIGLGMKILIREGSGAKNFDELISLMDIAPGSLMFCTDDSHPDELTKGHINELVKRAISAGFNHFDVLRAASLNASLHYGLNIGLLRAHDRADFIVVDSLKEMQVISTYIEGVPVFAKEKTYIPSVDTKIVNAFAKRKISSSDLLVVKSSNRMKVIEAIDGSLITRRGEVLLPDEITEVKSKPEEDLLKIVVVNRYDPDIKPVIGFIRGFGIKHGAISSSIAHDSHHVICVGTSDKAMEESINWIFNRRGGIAVHDGRSIHGLSLPIAGLMTSQPVEVVGKEYMKLTRMIGGLGSSLHAPFMTLSFMALLVIPSLKIGDRGLFDVDRFSFTPLFEPST